jgi:hypothetical protein
MPEGGPGGRPHRLEATGRHYPFIAYGQRLAGLRAPGDRRGVLGPLRDPVGNVRVVQFGMIACATDRAVSGTASEIIFGDVPDFSFSLAISSRYSAVAGARRSSV